MFNCIITGCGRSGTSMIAGLLHNGKYKFGGKLIKPRSVNPKGFFESKIINDINERILMPYSPDIIYGQRWLYPINITKKKVLPKKIVSDIKRKVFDSPFCYKDPRFSYTLPMWIPHLNKTRFICVFRDPRKTINSIVHICKEDLRIPITRKRAERVWLSMYNSILQIRRQSKNNWYFIHYQQAFDKDKLYALSGFLNSSLNLTFPDWNVKKTPFKSKDVCSKDSYNLYNKLCKLANYA